MWSASFTGSSVQMPSTDLKLPSRSFHFNVPGPLPRSLIVCWQGLMNSCDFIMLSMNTRSPSRFVTRQVLILLKRSGYLGKFVKVCQITSRGAATSKHDVERARRFFCSEFSLPALPAGDSAELLSFASFGSFAEQILEPVSVPEIVNVAIRQRAVLLGREINFKAENLKRRTSV